MSFNVQVTGNGAQVTPVVGEGEGEVGCKCTKEQWPNIIVLMGFIASFLVCLLSVLTILKFEGVPSVILSVYLIVLAILALLAEFRRFKVVRGMVYPIIKFVYFLTGYYGRGLFYVFLGSIMLDDAALNIITGGFVMGLGVLIMIVHFIVKLPAYVDWQVVKEEAEERIRREAERRFRTGQTPQAAVTHGDGYGQGAYGQGGYTAPNTNTNAPPLPQAQPVAYAVGSPDYSDNAAYAQKGPASADGRDPYDDEEPIRSTTRAAKQDQALEDEYYGGGGAGGGGNSKRGFDDDEDPFSPTETRRGGGGRGNNTSSTNNNKEYDPFSRSDNQYKPPKF